MNKPVEKVALVTGGNRGIGLQTCKDLAKRGFKVILTSRSHDKGKQASQIISKEGLEVKFHQLDVTDQESITEVEKYLRTNFGKLDVLINNAAIYFDGYPNNASFDEIQKTLNANLLGPWMLTQALLPLLEQSSSGRVINISSGAGELASKATSYAAYSISKLGLNGLTRMFAQDHPSLSINAVDPGWVRTEMGGMEAERSLEQGAETIVWLASLENPPTGKFLRDHKELMW